MCVLPVESYLMSSSVRLARDVASKLTWVTFSKVASPGKMIKSWYISYGNSAILARVIPSLLYSQTWVSQVHNDTGRPEGKLTSSTAPLILFFQSSPLAINAPDRYLTLHKSLPPSHIYPRSRSNASDWLMIRSA